VATQTNNMDNKRVLMRIISKNRVLRRIYGQARRRYMEV
jgi:hypothetical protein